MSKISRKQLKRKLKELPQNLSMAGLALILSLAEGGANALSGILKGPREGIGKTYERVIKLKSVQDYYKELKNLKENSVRIILWKLEKKGLVTKKQKEKQKYYQLTNLGLKVAKKFQKVIEQPWDGKWRIVMFDIPEKIRTERKWLRFQLIAFDYKPLQKSVFIGQKPLDEEFYKELLNRDLNQWVRLITVGEIDDEQVLKNF
ncbi:hypothetical protein COS59_00500 [Candidatus Wolfebacteria bacterium CG03_land_8_20_14_0_80_36_15]|uniref:Transcriptional repressor PaaX-like central Cas2-like domain-containing protein n=1 Tax=Candidatus Wolfebacteria bacterium CG03_land_8_20_14_0_80_36_15 TaxID=1975067 RepID=A0A2M7B857_9BACT|nr:MAG: hypothetical protein COS59_00500 [Candidatus Wolfebacteria bacterium CG03_land_8_20_14_0_80_36_15]